MIKKFTVSNMTCSACSNAIEKNVNKISGVKTATVNLMNNTLIVDYNENKVKVSEIINSVTSLGYKISVLGEQKDKTKSINYENTLKQRFIISLIFLAPLLIITMGHMVGMPLPTFMSPEKNPSNFVLIQLILTIPIVLINYKFYVSGYKAIINKSPNMDTLVSIGAIVAFVYSLVLCFIINYNVSIQLMEKATKLSMNSFFESSAMILTLVTLGKWLEEKSKGKTKDEINKLLKLKPSLVRIIENNEEKVIELEQLKIDDIVVIKPGDYIPCDGIIIEGHSTIDKSAITGESLPVEVNVNDYVTSASINKSGLIKIKAQKIGANTMLSKIIELVENSGNKKAPIAKLADKVSKYFVPSIIVISLISFVVWIILSKNFSYSLNIAISVLVISCPCALGLATPVAIMVGTGVGSKFGILFKDAETLEKLKSVKNIVLDKTATITEGKLSVVNIVSFNFDKNMLLNIAMSLEKISSHPLSECIVKYGESKNLKPFKIYNYNYIIGKGITGDINGITYFLGNEKLLKENNIKIENINAIKPNSTPIFLASNKLLGAIIVEDKIKPSSKIAIKNFNDNFLNVYMLSGDNKTTANAVAKEVGIKNVYSEIMPEDKVNIVTNLQISSTTAMVGDGINDAPALKAADVGIAIGNGTDVAIEAADVVLVNNNLMDVNLAINLSKKTVTNIKQNLFWAFFYNTIGIPIAAGVLVPINIVLNPMIAALAMSLSSLCVVGNALRLRLFNNKKKEKHKLITIKIEGMSCEHCKKHIEDALNSFKNVKASVDLKNNLANVEVTGEVSFDALKSAVVELGYIVTEIK